MFQPKLWTTLRTYNRKQLLADLLAGSDTWQVG